MTFLIIFGILLLLVYIIAFNNRDKSQDYKISPVIRNISNEDRLRADIIHSLDKKIKSVINPTESKKNNDILISEVIIVRQNSLFDNRADIAKQYNLSIITTGDIIFECIESVSVSYLE